VWLDQTHQVIYLASTIRHMFTTLQIAQVLFVLQQLIVVDLACKVVIPHFLASLSDVRFTDSNAQAVCDRGTHTTHTHTLSLCVCMYMCVCVTNAANFQVQRDIWPMIRSLWGDLLRDSDGYIRAVTQNAYFQYARFSVHDYNAALNACDREILIAFLGAMSSDVATAVC
jgi:hypothetical protein